MKVATNCKGLGCMSLTCRTCSLDISSVQSDISFHCPSHTVSRTFSSNSLQEQSIGGEKIKKEPLHSFSVPNDSFIKARESSKKERKAKLARASRRRKKEYQKELEVQIDRLQEKISLLESSMKPNGNYHQNDSSTKSVYEKASIPLEKSIKTLEPLSAEKFVLWVMSQKDEFYQGPGLWSSLLFDELGLYETAIADLNLSRPISSEIVRQLDQIHQMTLPIGHQLFQLQQFNATLHSILSQSQVEALVCAFKRLRSSP